MRIPADAIIADEKLTRYLLVHRPSDDKSKFLAQAGFTIYNWPVLRQAIRALADAAEAVEENADEYGVFFQVRGSLSGPAGILHVKLVWMRRAIDGRFYFVTLVPRKE